jgi:hypothetical protein
LPPAVDGLRAQAAAFAEYGTRSDSDVPRHLVGIEGADSALATATPVFSLPHSSATAIGLLLLDASDRVRGMVIGVGGAERRTLWYAMPRLGPKWSSVLDRLHNVDSTSNSSAHDATTARGPIRGIPLGGTLAFAQPVYSWRAQGPPTLSRVGLLIEDTVHVGSSLVQLAGASPAVPLSSASLSGDLRARAGALYARMREALRRGDWTAFGRAFDELGQLLGGGVGTAPR